ncbi:carbonic anhydrase 4-like [Heterodontus francisci]|uniref:carbonic anhydrase 4-like n=1 Tax=Heterodontus francisci TaxID=7792 RepID=UPI00355C9D5F
MGMQTLLAFLLLGIPQLEAATGPFCYHDPKCAPPSWPAQYPTCSGSRQSPIDIQTEAADRDNDLGEFTFHMYANRQLPLKIKHTAMSVKVTLNTSMELSGGGLKADYVALQFHFHWGSNVTSPGSEHAMDGKRAGMELHIVHRQKGLNLSSAINHPEGLAVLGFLIEIENGISEDPAWKNLTKNLKYLKNDGDYRDLNGTVSLMELIQSVNLTKYYRYNGSLTTPECNEVVSWTVFEEPIRLNASLVEAFFEDLYVNQTAGIKLLDNFRPTQSNSNKVWASRGATRASDPRSTTQQQTKTTHSGSIGTRSPVLGLLLAVASLFLLPF